jgi:hypothetical protein
MDEDLHFTAHPKLVCSNVIDLFWDHIMMHDDRYLTKLGGQVLHKTRQKGSSAYKKTSPLPGCCITTMRPGTCFYTSMHSWQNAMCTATLQSWSTCFCFRGSRTHSKDAVLTAFSYPSNRNNNSKWSSCWGL